MNKVCTLSAAAVLAVLGMSLTGCTSYVKVYDATGQLVGSCKSGSKLLWIIPSPFGNSGCSIQSFK
jgi:hypothetical protein